jgi:hypothetical protein
MAKAAHPANVAVAAALAVVRGGHKRAVVVGTRAVAQTKALEALLTCGTQ